MDPGAGSFFFLWSKQLRQLLYETPPVSRPRCEKPHTADEFIPESIFNLEGQLQIFLGVITPCEHVAAQPMQTFYAVFKLSAFRGSPAIRPLPH